MEPPSSSTDIMTEELTKQLAQNTTLHFNLDQNAIVTTEDKARLALLTHLETVEKKNSWIAPAGIFVAVLTTLITSDFKDRWFPAATWQAFFLCIGGASLIWFAVALKNAFASSTIDDIISALKTSSQIQAIPPLAAPNPEGASSGFAREQ